MNLISTKETDAGVMKIFEDETKTRYEIYTRAGFYRGGKIYFADKVVEILSGKTIVTLEINGEDTEITLSPESGKYIIPAGIPNIFYFPEDTQMVEEFEKGTESEEFERYRAMKK